MPTGADGKAKATWPATTTMCLSPVGDCEVLDNIGEFVLDEERPSLDTIAVLNFIYEGNPNVFEED